MNNASCSVSKNFPYIFIDTSSVFGWTSAIVVICVNPSLYVIIDGNICDLIISLWKGWVCHHHHQQQPCGWVPGCGVADDEMAGLVEWWWSVDHRVDVSGVVCVPWRWRLPRATQRIPWQRPLADHSDTGILISHPLYHLTLINKITFRPARDIIHLEMTIFMFWEERIDRNYIHLKCPTNLIGHSYFMNCRNDIDCMTFLRVWVCVCVKQPGYGDKTHTRTNAYT